MRHRTVSSKQKNSKKIYPVDIAWCPIDKFMKLRYPTDKSMTNSVYQTKSRMRSVPQINVTFAIYVVLTEVTTIHMV
jgi:hypothetical protein